MEALEVMALSDLSKMLVLAALVEMAVVSLLVI
jgi:hypothetical protein